MDALREIVPAVAARLPRLTLGEWPTPLEPLPGQDGVWVKREDLSSPHYGGNKVRCLEPVLGALRAAGQERACATGAYGSNQALAHVVHGQRHGFTCGALLFPQPPSPSAAANLRTLVGLGPRLHLTRNILGFPWEY
ncbi:MAG: pyridoxal-phosphate dependent enzyme, partial [Myxococcales bacterium]|nr:pyridoxal-phosphate dependent enzyme [Myxococcales bacterium]